MITLYLSETGSWPMKSTEISYQGASQIGKGRRSGGWPVCRANLQHWAILQVFGYSLSQVLQVEVRRQQANHTVGSRVARCGLLIYVVDEVGREHSGAFWDVNLISYADEAPDV